MTSRAADIIPVGVSTAAAAAQENWVEVQATQLTCLRQGDRELAAAQLKCAGTRVGLDWALRFASKVLGFAFWTGIIFASVIGVALWATKIPSRHTPAAITAAAYLLIAIVAAPACRGQALRILNHMSRISDGAVHDFLFLYLSVLAVAAALYGIVNASTFSPANAHHVSLFFYVHEFTAFVVVAALGLVIAYLTLAFAYASALQESASGETLNWAGTLVASAITTWFPTARSSHRPAGNHCLDSGLLRLLGCTATIENLGRGQHLADQRTVKTAIATLELAAEDIEQYAITRVPRLDATTRHLARGHGVHLASVVRNAKAQIATAVHPHDYTAVASELAGFLLAWACSEQRDFIGINDTNSSIKQVPLWRRVTGRIWNATLLAAGGIFLPLLPIYDSDHAAAAGLRYALLTAAILALATNGAPASGIIQRNLESTLSNHSDHTTS